MASQKQNTRADGEHKARAETATPGLEYLTTPLVSDVDGKQIYADLGDIGELNTAAVVAKARADLLDLIESMPRDVSAFELQVGDGHMTETPEALVHRVFSRLYPQLGHLPPPKLVQEAIAAHRGRGRPRKGERGLNVIMAEIGCYLAGESASERSIARQKQRRRARE